MILLLSGRELAQHFIIGTKILNKKLLKGRRAGLGLHREATFHHGRRRGCESVRHLVTVYPRSRSTDECLIG